MQVSVIVTAYNEERWLGRCLDSLIKQTLTTGLEIIVIDDGSTDQTAIICDQYQRQTPQLIRVIHQDNQGQGPARNVGIGLARGRYLGFVDADDWVEPTMYATMLATALRSRAQIVVCDVCKLYVSEQRSTCLPSLSEATDHVDIDQYIKMGLNNAYSGNKLYQRECWQHYQYRAMVYEDLDILLDMLGDCQRVAYVQEPFYNYYKHAGSTTLDYCNPRLFDIMTAYQDAIKKATPRYRDAITYCVAKRILINLATPGFADYLAEFTELIQQLRPALLASPSVMRDKQIKQILYYANKLTLPRRLIGSHDLWVAPWLTYSRGLQRLPIKHEQLPAELQTSSEAVQQDYWQLQMLYQTGGLLVLGPVALKRPFGQLRAGGPFILYDSNRVGVAMGAQPQAPVVFELMQRLIAAHGQTSLARLLVLINTNADQWLATNPDLRLLSTAELIS